MRGPQRTAKGGWISESRPGRVRDRSNHSRTNVSPVLEPTILRCNRIAEWQEARHPTRRRTLPHEASQGGTRCRGMAGSHGSVVADCRERRPDDVRPDRRNAGAQASCRTEVQPGPEANALGAEEVGEGSIINDRPGVTGVALKDDPSSPAPRLFRLLFRRDLFSGLFVCHSLTSD